MIKGVIKIERGNIDVLVKIYREKKDIAVGEGCRDGKEERGQSELSVIMSTQNARNGNLSIEMVRLAAEFQYVYKVFTRARRRVLSFPSSLMISSPPILLSPPLPFSYLLPSTMVRHIQLN
jgi:hypothetical protein